MGNTWALVQTIAPTVECVSVSDVHTQARIDSSDEDAYISGTLIPAARELAESYTQRCFTNTTFRYVLDEWPLNRVLRLPRVPLVSVTSVKYYDQNATEQTVTATDYTVHTDAEPGFIEIDQEYNYPTLYGDSADVRIVFVAGYGVVATGVPATIRLALAKTVAYWFDNRQEIGRFPDDVLALLSPFRLGILQWP